MFGIWITKKKNQPPPKKKQKPHDDDDKRKKKSGPRQGFKISPFYTETLKCFKHEFIANLLFSSKQNG